MAVISEKGIELTPQELAHAEAAGQVEREDEMEELLQDAPRVAVNNDGAEAPGAAGKPSVTDEATTATDDRSSTDDDLLAATATEEIEGNENLERENSQDNLFNQATQRTAAERAAAEKQPVEERSATEAIEHKDTDLVMYNGRPVPWAQVKGMGVLKERYDKREEEIQREREELRKKQEPIDRAKPIVDALLSDVYGRTYADVLIQTNDPERARKAAEAAAGVGAPKAEAQQDPRLTPPIDPETNEPVEEGSIEWTRWRTGDYAKAMGEAGFKGAQSEADAARQKSEREANARAAAEAEAKATADRTAKTIVDNNLQVLNQIGPLLLERGIDTRTMSDAQWQNVQNVFAETAKRYGKDVRNNDYLQTTWLEKGDVAAILDAKGGPVDQLLADRSSAAAGGKAGTKTETGDRPGPKAVADEPTETERKATADAKEQKSRGKLATHYAPKAPLNAGPQSETFPSRDAGYQYHDPEEQLREADVELGL